MSARGPEGQWGSGARQRSRGLRQAGTCSPGLLHPACRPGHRQFPPRLLLFLIEYLGTGHRTERGNTCFQQETRWGEASTRLPMASHRACSLEPCKSEPRKPWRSFFKKIAFCFSPPHTHTPSIPKPQRLFLKVFFPLWGFPPLPKAPPTPVSAGTFTSFQSLLLQLHSASGSFSLPQPPVDLQVGSGIRGQRNKGNGEPLSRARHPFSSLVWAGEEGFNSSARGRPSRAQALSRGEQPEDAWEVGMAFAADQQADPRRTGLRGRGR